MTADQHGGHRAPAYSDEEWNAWKDYADRVVVEVRFKAWPGADDAPDVWRLEADVDGTAWEKDWLVRQLIELAAADAENSCCGRGNYMLDSHDRKTEWGASGAGFDAVLTLSQNLFSEATWAALGALAATLRARIRDKQPGWDDNLPSPADEGRERALQTVMGSQRISRDDLRVLSFEAVDADTVLVEVKDVRTGIVYTVENCRHGAAVRRSRIRKFTDPDSV